MSPDSNYSSEDGEYTVGVIHVLVRQGKAIKPVVLRQGECKFRERFPPENVNALGEPEYWRRWYSVAVRIGTEPAEARRYERDPDVDAAETNRLYRPR